MNTDIRTYMAAALAVCGLLTALSLLRLPSEVERAERAAFSVLLIAALATPTASVLSYIGTLIRLPSGERPTPDTSVYEQTLTDAFSEGVRRAVCEKFSVRAEAVRVGVRGFSVKEGRAESITVLLLGEAWHVDHRAVKSYIEKEGWGACEVRRESG